MNITPINTQNSFGSLNVGGSKLFYEEEAAVLKPLEEFAKTQFEDFGEIHVQLIKPQKQEGFFRECEQYYHDYNISISPMGLKNGTPDYEYRVVTAKLDSLGKNLKEALDEILQYIKIRYNVNNRIAPQDEGVKNMKKAIEVLSEDGYNEIFFA